MPTEQVELPANFEITVARPDGSFRQYRAGAGGAFPVDTQDLDTITDALAARGKKPPTIHPVGGTVFKLPKAAGEVTVTRPSGEVVTYKPGDEINPLDVPSVSSAVGDLDQTKEDR